MKLKNLLFDFVGINHVIKREFYPDIKQTLILVSYLIGNRHRREWRVAENPNIHTYQLYTVLSLVHILSHTLREKTYASCKCEKTTEEIGMYVCTKTAKYISRHILNR